jgi:transposase
MPSGDVRIVRANQKEADMTDDRGTRVALARWQVIAPATDRRLSPAERGLLLSEIAAAVHRDADGRPVRVTRRTLYRWLAAWSAHGFEGLKPSKRRDAGTHKVDPAVLHLAAALRQEGPARSAAQVAEILDRTRDAQVHPRTLQRFFAANGLDRARLEAATARTAGSRPPLAGTCGPPTPGTAHPSSSWTAVTRSCSALLTTTPG